MKTSNSDKTLNQTPGLDKSDQTGGLEIHPSKALVFDLKRFAVHDGKGLRTTVFFKGCPLRCKWCQNPEGLESHRRPVFLKKQCIGCKTCLHLADQDQIHWKEDHPVINYASIGGFEAIVDGCPARAIRYDCEAYTVDQLLEKIRRDEVFFQKDGGVTFSGGEPFLQGQFLVDILSACKQAGLNTAIESSFYADHNLVKQAVALLDHVYCDLKVLDWQKHKEATGTDNRRILENIAWMISDPDISKRVIVRTPLIPGYTATDENIAGIAKWLSDHNPEVHWEMLNYNPLAPSKYEMAGKIWTLEDAKPFSKAQLEHFYQIARENGIRNLVIEK